MMGPMDKFIKKRKKDDIPEQDSKTENTNKDEAEKKSLKQKSIPMEEEVDNKQKELDNKIITDDDINLKFYPTYESFIDKLSRAAIIGAANPAPILEPIAFATPEGVKSIPLFFSCGSISKDTCSLYCGYLAIIFSASSLLSISLYCGYLVFIFSENSL